MGTEVVVCFISNRAALPMLGHTGVVLSACRVGSRPSCQLQL